VALGVKVTELPTHTALDEEVMETFIGAGRMFMANEFEVILIEFGQASALGVNTREMVFAVVKVSVMRLVELLPTATPFTLQE